MSREGKGRKEKEKGKEVYERKEGQEKERGKLKKI